jgi:hypothetical protein
VNIVPVGASSGFGYPARIAEKLAGFDPSKPVAALADFRPHNCCRTYFPPTPRIDHDGFQGPAMGLPCECITDAALDLSIHSILPIVPLCAF